MHHLVDMRLLTFKTAAARLHKTRCISVSSGSRRRIALRCVCRYNLLSFATAEVRKLERTGDASHHETSSAIYRIK